MICNVRRTFCSSVFWYSGRPDHTYMMNASLVIYAVKGMGDGNIGQFYKIKTNYPKSTHLEYHIRVFYRVLNIMRTVTLQR